MMQHRKLTRREQLVSAINEQQLWITEHGGNLTGYVIYYGAASNPEHSGEGGEAIYNADLNALIDLQERLARC